MDPWRRFAKTLLLSAAGLVGGLYLFVIAVDPWGSLPLSLPLPRVPISSNARFAFPVLARSPRFDAAVFGTSTARLLRPVDLDPEFGARFVNLAMNSATAWEQSQMLGVFLRAHPHPAAILIDMDAAWCGESAERLTPRPFPDWMYRRNRWPGYAEMFTPYAVQEAFNLVLVLLHVKQSSYGTDGYTSFVPPDASYDPARVDAAFARWPPTNEQPTAPDAPQAFPNLPLLAQDPGGNPARHAHRAVLSARAYGAAGAARLLDGGAVGGVQAGGGGAGRRAGDGAGHADPERHHPGSQQFLGPVALPGGGRRAGRGAAGGCAKRRGAGFGAVVD